MPHELPGLRRIEVAPEDGVYVVPDYSDIDKQRSQKIIEVTFHDGEEVGLNAALKGELPSSPKAAAVEEQTSKTKRGKGKQTPESITAVSPEAIPQAQPVVSHVLGYTVSVQSAMGILEAEAADIIDDKKIFGICYDCKKRGNRIVPTPAVGKIDVTVVNRETDDEAIYSVEPLGVSFTIPKSNLLVVLFEKLE
jgi:hypothetical protein